MKYILLFTCFALSIPRLDVAAGKMSLSLAFLPPGRSVQGTSILKMMGKPQEIVLSAQLSAEIERIIAATQLGERVDRELLRWGNLQEIIWQLQEMGAEQQSRELTLLLQATLENAEIDNIEDIGIGRSGAKLVTLADGIRGVFKTASDGRDEFIREVMVYNFDRLIGTNVFPLTTLRTIDGDEGSIQLVIENSRSAYDIAEDEPARNRGNELDASPNVKTLRLLTLNSDRSNPQNYLFPHVGRIVAIDGSRAFTEEVDVTEHLRDEPDAFNLDPTFVAQLQSLRLSSTFTEGDALLSSLPVKEIKEFEQMIDLVRVNEAVGEYVMIASAIDPRSIENLLAALREGDLDTARAALDKGKGVSGEIAMEKALASHNFEAVEQLYELGYPPNDSARMKDLLKSALESAIKSKEWQFVDWAVLEEKVYDLRDLGNYEKYVDNFWKREDLAYLLELAGKAGYNSAFFIGAALDRALAKGYLAKSMLIFERAIEYDISEYIDESDISVYILKIAEAALVAKKHDITERLVDVAEGILPDDDLDLLGHGYLGGISSSKKELVGWLIDNRLYTDDSFNNILERKIRFRNYEVDRILALFMLRKYFATRNQADIAVKLLDSGKYDIAGYLFEVSNVETRIQILLRIAKTNEEYFMYLTDNLSWKDER